MNVPSSMRPNSSRFVASLFVVSLVLVSLCASKANAGLILPDINVTFRTLYTGPSGSPMTAADLSHPAFSNSTVAQKEAFLDPGKFLLFGGASTLKTKLGQTPLPPLYLGDGNASSSATFLLSASVDSAGNLASGGIFEVRGSETVSGGTITLLKGTLTELSQAVFAENKLHFKASVDTSSDLYSLFGDEIVIETHSLGPMDFTDWFMVSNRTADMGRPVPEPSTFFALGAVVCVGGLQRRRKAKTAA